MQFKVCLEKVTLGEEDAIRGMPGKSLEDMSAAHIYILDARSSLSFLKRQVRQIRGILHAPNSPRLAHVSKSAIEAGIGGWFKPTYLELSQMHLKNSRY
jgi:hypothetical protein